MEVPRSRRSVLRRLAATSGGFVAGCIGGRPVRRTRPLQSSTGRGNSVLRSQLGLSTPAYDIEGELRVFQWKNYWPRETVRTFESAFGVDVTVDYYGSNEEMYRGLRDRGTAPYDLIFPSGYFVTGLAERGEVASFDLAKLPNWSNLETRWQVNPPYDPGPGRHSVPYQWGTVGVGWNRELASFADPVSWAVLWDPDYAGRITMLNDVRQTLGVALKRLGYSLNTTSESEIREAGELLREQRPLLREYNSTNMVSNLVDRRASPIHTWSGHAFVAYWHLFADGGSPIEYRIPEEGGVMWVDTVAMPVDARHPGAAHAFVDYLLDPRVNASISNYVFYATPNEAAWPYVDDWILENPDIYPPPDRLEKLEFVRDVGPAIQTYDEVWEDATGLSASDRIRASSARDLWPMPVTPPRPDTAAPRATEYARSPAVSHLEARR
ncbi:spermidine/putrescine ABC transporter substrate-binding protein [Haloarchaeobius sp. HME9146]|uniref:polyamine ABC transporter substrate-binding protein n=1 Tax=Haloarchaeobius sp. HME9146 TaxID=2978732 RepID=UPI0021C06A39|nr:spermidine/putrescine ABC transporter substrate-binding protein [Haloarchaeobius sp. HME9146]MCT9097702.1 spermidine/putrescine ABC transporter substrate-binding protein [Haloarchaeobius sp. HME9146]